MKVRAYTEQDLDRIKQIYGLQGYEYAFPDMGMFTEHIVLDEGGEIPMSVAAKLTADIWLFLDPTWETPGIRYETAMKLHGPMEALLRDRGVKEVHAWPPPKIFKSLTRRLKNHGWEPTEWQALAREVK